MSEQLKYRKGQGFAKHRIGYEEIHHESRKLINSWRTLFIPGHNRGFPRLERNRIDWI